MTCPIHIRVQSTVQYEPEANFTLPPTREIRHANYSGHQCFKSCLLLMHQNQYLWSKGLKNDEKKSLHVLCVYLLINNPSPVKRKR